MLAISIHDLTVAYDEKPVLWDVDLKIPYGKTMGIIGPNGAGKSTLIKAILSLVKPTSGKITFYNQQQEQITNLKNYIAYVPQCETVDWDFPITVIDVVMMGRYGYLSLLQRPGKKEKSMAYEMLKKVEMEKYANRQISQLSGGQQQRVFLARALIQEASIYFLDEPFKGVDVKTEEIIIKLLQELKSQGKTIIVVHHDLNTVKKYFDYLTLIDLKIIASGPTAEVFTKENLAKTYHHQFNEEIEVS